ncbi:N-acylglucosamine 2-epimerase [Ancylobacter novellus DSM 506]|uniref:N-acylglucosamine 2-epimerase n=1 Tax=Ancylobacter novellus (strain ATCC 8093 / DSM 506 / JCM 20403 / CCM 1077 / IAM 12100 / NBRC 12443 / NCIMB 10456) TaxID=639283 RepID=D7A2M4_ANCN5|nr:AGE family epimerase/isomerase [Ancylobacter novellus]ADH91554.1 N-acylglucosamine 2-epimerase [Ancylobacter novellus DSM 506]
MTAIFAPAQATDLSAWLKGRFIPRWVERTCRPGLRGYVEEYRASEQWQPLPSEHTTMVTGRLVYTFSMAYRFDKAPGTLRGAEHGLAFLLDSCRLTTGHFAHRVGSDGRVVDPRGDLYDLAFVLLALGGYSAATGKTEVLTVAEEIAVRLDSEWLDPLGGYREPSGAELLRLQYPQMHLFEAFQMLAAADSNGGWLGRAERIVDLAARLVDEHGAIDEWFGPQWDAVEPKRRQREIGHHFEWAWLLFVYATKTGSTRATHLAWRLFDFGLKAAGVPATGPDQTIPNSIDAWGTFTSARRPFWPTVELAKASLAAATLDGKNDRRTLAARSLETVLSQIDQNNDTWINEIEFHSLNICASLPTRTLYHIIPCLIFYANINNPEVYLDNINILDPFR